MSKYIYIFYMTSCLTFDLWYDLNIQRIQRLSTGHAHVQISGLYHEVNFSKIEGKLEEYPNVQFKQPKIQVSSFFQWWVNEYCKLCLSVEWLKFTYYNENVSYMITLCIKNSILKNNFHWCLYYLKTISSMLQYHVLWSLEVCGVRSRSPGRHEPVVTQTPKGP